ncbi:hypothetical protein O181_037150 [Austropuccinia psidii MF-1]|uniref:Uncharacterized protein n=1 Tax=Austropuccinia psidii MF-1 TaxID=1389203 RepID=A0A9Q3DAB5_9BASI|nr:hypothetical protein [Austropuccinia psidii MF-1]
MKTPDTHMLRWQIEIQEYRVNITIVHKFIGTNLSSSEAYHSQTDGLEVKIIQALEDMIRRFCAYGLELKYSGGFTHEWCTLILALELEDRKSSYPATGQTPVMLEKESNPRLPEDTLRNHLI